MTKARVFEIKNRPLQSFALGAIERRSVRKTHWKLASRESYVTARNADREVDARKRHDFITMVVARKSQAQETGSG
jgi:hypothetical protein